MEYDRLNQTVDDIFAHNAKTGYYWRIEICFTDDKTREKKWSSNLQIMKSITLCTTYELRNPHRILCGKDFLTYLESIGEFKWTKMKLKVYNTSKIAPEELDLMRRFKETWQDYFRDKSCNDPLCKFVAVYFVSSFRTQYVI